MYPSFSKTVYALETVLGLIPSSLASSLHEGSLSSNRKTFKEINKTEEDLKRLLGQEDEEEKQKKSRIIKDANEIDFKNMTTLIIESKISYSLFSPFLLPRKYIIIQKI